MKTRPIRTVCLLLTLFTLLPATESHAQLFKRKNRSRNTINTPAAEVRKEPAATEFLSPDPNEARGPRHSRAMSDEEWAMAGIIGDLLQAEQYDSLFSRWYEENVIRTYDDYFTQFINIDSVSFPQGDTPDSVYIARLRMMVSPIHLGYNDVVKNRILAYTRWKGTMSRIIGLSQLYFPMIEERLDAHGLPIELRMLPVIESAMNPTAVSRMGASGLWQFMYATGKSYGLEVTSFVDQRFDPVASTEAACLFLKDLYKMYGDWTLALAAYNCGPGNVNKAIKRAGEKANNFWEIYSYLPRETRGYVPAFIAATYAFTFHRQHGIEPSPPPLPMARDTVHLTKLTHFEQISSTLGTPIETIRELNPQYKMDIIPAVEGKVYSLALPQRDIARYIELRDEINAKDSLYLAQYLNGGKTKVKEIDISSVEYRVKSGDTLGAIAKKHGVTVNQLMKWNNLKNAHTLRIGQRIQIYK